MGYRGGGGGGGPLNLDQVADGVTYRRVVQVDDSGHVTTGSIRDHQVNSDKTVGWSGSFSINNANLTFANGLLVNATFSS